MLYNSLEPYKGLLDSSLSIGGGEDMEEGGGDRKGSFRKVRFVGVKRRADSYCVIRFEERNNNYPKIGLFDRISFRSNR